MDELWSIKPSILVLFFLASTDGYGSKLAPTRIGASRASTLSEQLLQGKNTSRWPQQSSKAPTVGVYIYIYMRSI